MQSTPYRVSLFKVIANDFTTPPLVVMAVIIIGLIFLANRANLVLLGLAVFSLFIAFTALRYPRYARIMQHSLSVPARIVSADGAGLISNGQIGMNSGWNRYTSLVLSYKVNDHTFSKTLLLRTALVATLGDSPVLIVSQSDANDCFLRDAYCDPV